MIDYNDINIDILASPSDINCIWYDASTVFTMACILNKAMDDWSQQMSGS